MSRLLIVDDDKNIRVNLAKFFESCGHNVSVAESAAVAIATLAEEEDFDVVLTDFRMAEMNGLELLEQIKRRRPDAPVILMTAYGTIQNAVESIKAGAFHYVTKPFALAEIRHLVDRALEVKSLRSQVRELRSAIDGVALLDSRSAPMQALLQIARQAAASDAVILLMGESGTGKNVLARQIHEWSMRRDRPFVTVNCTNLAEPLIESELFGHVRGSFTGAIKDKPGRLETADGGTVFLDEITDLTPSLQTKFLRFLQEQRFERVGGQQTIEVNTRIIAASNRDLPQEVAVGRFRADLFYRLNVIALTLPPLRARQEDVLPLAGQFLTVSNVRNGRTALQLSPEAAQALTEYSWPGNIRELRNAIERASVLSRGPLIEKEDLPEVMFQSIPETAPAPADATLDQVEEDHIRRVLSQSGTLEAAADSLGIGIATLWRKRKRYNIQ
jgi:two-component system, NtrC family, response regulator AlgB